MLKNAVAATNPYPGLRPYQSTEQTTFYGRDADTQALLEKILANRLTLLFAATGVGKSSLLQAAILPKLSSDQGLKLDVVYYNDWIAPPIQGLQAAIRQALLARYGTIPETNAANLEAFFQAIKSYTTTPLVLILDQFEEFFRYRFIHHAADFQTFIDQLSAVILSDELNVSLVFSMREDFALELNAFKPHLPNPLFSHYYRLEKLGVEAARQAITEPLIQANYHYEPELLERLLSDLLSRDLTRDASSLAKGTQADSVEPPYLQIVCSQLWELDKNDPEKTLRLVTYNQAGGAKGLLENYVNYVMKGFSDREKQVTSKAFDHLISRRGTKMAHTPEDLAELVNLKPAELANVMDKLEKARILRRQQRDKQVWYELYHDMFSGGIEHWNTAWKNHMRLRRSVIGTVASLAALAVIYFSVVAYLQATSKHLRLGNDNTDRVEIYTGTSKFPDPFGQQHYFSETNFERGNLELDKRYAKRDILDYPLVVRELISSHPIDKRIQLYTQHGEFCLYSDLFSQLLLKPAPGCNKPQQVSRSPVSKKDSKLRASNNDLMLNSFLFNFPNSLKTAWGLEQAKALAETQPDLIPSETIQSIPLTAPIRADKNELLRHIVMQSGYIEYTPEQIAVVLEWLLEPTKFELGNQAATPVDTVRVLLDRGDILLPLLQIMQVMNVQPRLLQALAADNAQQREVAAILAGLTRDPVFIEPLTRLVADKSNSIKTAALQSLFLIQPEPTIILATKLLNDRTQPADLRNSLIQYLAGTYSLNASSALLSRFQDPNEREEIRMFSARALGYLGDTSVLPMLHTALTDPNERSEVRSGAIDGIKLIGDKTSTGLLLERLKDPDERLDIRIYCAGALGALAATEASPTLLALIADPKVDDNLKIEAISALAYSDDATVPARLFVILKALPAQSKLLLGLVSTLESFNAPQITELLKANGLGSNTFIYTDQERLQDQVQAFINNKTKHYQPISTTNFMDSTQQSFTLNAKLGFYSNDLSGSYEQRQGIRKALKMKDASKNLALAQLAADETNTVKLRLEALKNISASPASPELMQLLQKLSKDSKRLIRFETINALLKVAEGKDLLPWLANSNMPIETLEQGLERLATTSSHADAVNGLLTFAKDDKSPLQVKAYQLLGDVKAVEVLPLVEANLASLEKEYQTWRAVRDAQPKDTVDDAVYQAWQEKLVASEPAHARLASHYAYVLAQLDFEKGQALLAHDLADVRSGAVLAFNQSASVTDLQTLAKIRAEKPNEPLFQASSYLAIDMALARLEKTTDPLTLQALQQWQSQLKQPNDSISQRLDWTVAMIKHNQTLDQEFEQKYQLKRAE